MINPSNLTTAIKQLNDEIRKEPSELTQKENTLRATFAEIQTLKTSLLDKEKEIKQKELEIQRLKTEILQTKNKINENERNSRKQSDEITEIRRDQAVKNQQLSKAQADYQSAIKNPSK